MKHKVQDMSAESLSLARDQRMNLPPTWPN